MDYYYPNMTAEQKESDLEHTGTSAHTYTTGKKKTNGEGHCLEALRTSMMCHPDLTPHPFYWSNVRGHVLNPNPNIKRECVSWDSLREFRAARHYDFEDLVLPDIQV